MIQSSNRKAVYTIDELCSLETNGLAQQFGGKISGLVNVIQLGKGEFLVPPFFAVSSGSGSGSGSEAEVEAEVETEAEAEEDFISGTVRQTTEEQINEALVDLQSQAVDKETVAKFAVRSSALCEDQKNESYAGQFESFLSLAKDDVVKHIQLVRDSAQNCNVTQYRRLIAKGESKDTMAVLVQLMVEADYAGVAFSVDPISLSNTVVVNVVAGLANDLVQGLVDGEHIVINKNEITRNRDCKIADSVLFDLEKQTKKLERLFGYPVDVEWAAVDQKIYILQVRPITASNDASAAGQLRIFDGSNIQESYPGITTPMTFSFVRRAYCEVYKSFVRLMGVSDEIIRQNEEIFTSMLGYIDGHIYYNLGSWYRLLAMLPAYKTNRGFMEKMMGLKDPALEVSQINNHKSQFFSRLKDNVNTGFALANIGRKYFKLESSKAKFYRRLDKTLAIERAELKTMDLDSLCRLYRSLEIELLTRWDAPIINDFFAMIFFGVYQKLSGKDNSYHSLIEGLGNVVSAKPPQIIKQIANLIKDDQALVQALLNSPQTSDTDLLFQAQYEAYSLYRAYLKEFGDRAIGELKLESQSVRDNPSLLLMTIATVANSMQTAARPTLSLVKNSLVDLEESAGSFTQNCPSTSVSWLNRLLLALISKPTRELIAGRENLRFARTQVFGLVREIMINIGAKLEQSALLDTRKDIFYLEVEEVLGFVEGTATCKNLKALAATRKAEESNFATIIPDRITINGAVSLHQQSAAAASKTMTAGKNQLQIKGLAACSGKVGGIARVIKDPINEHLLSGEILVAERTDPGWIMHFALCKGIVTSYGSMLSHTAIVARELRIPAVVAAKGATEEIKSGDLIEVDGTNGSVTIVRRREEIAAETRQIILSEKESFLENTKDCA